MSIEDGFKVAQIESLGLEMGIKQAQSDKDLIVKDEQIVSSQYDRTVKGTQLADQLATSDKQREALVEQIVNAKVELELKTTQTNTDVFIKNKELDDRILTSNKQRIILDSENAAKQFEVNNILPANLNNINTEIETKQRQIQVVETELEDKLLTSDKQRNLVNKQIDAVTSEIAIKESQSTQELALKQSQKSLIDRQAISEKSKADLANQQIQNAIKEATVIENNALKVEKEAALYDKKAITEDRQALLVFNQAQLYDAQRVGFDNDFTYKKVKLLTDMWSISASKGMTIAEPAQVVATRLSDIISSSLGIPKS